MAIIKDFVEFVATDALASAADAAKKGLDKASAAAKKQNEKKVQKFLDANPDHCHLFASQIKYKLKETYYIYDHEKNIRFIVKGELLSLKHHLHIYDASGRNELATIKEQLISVRAPITLDSDPKDFVITVGGKKIGKVKTKGAVTKKKFDVTFNDWCVEGDIGGKNYTVTDKHKEVVMTISQKLSLGHDLYFVDISDPKNEFYCVLILLALDAATTTKSEDTKRTIKKKTLL